MILGTSTPTETRQCRLAQCRWVFSLRRWNIFYWSRKCERREPPTRTESAMQRRRLARNKYNKSLRGRQNRGRYRYSIKLGVLRFYSGGLAKCVICGVDDMRALHLDHVNGDGATDRKSRTGSQRAAGSGFFLALKQAAFPSGYQVLCANCNAIKAWTEQKSYVLADGWRDR